MEYLAIIVCGLLLGVLINYLADVLPLMRTLTKPVCKNCHKEMDWRSYLLFQPCVNCKKRSVSRRILCTLFVTGFLLWQWNQPSQRLGFYLGTILFCYFCLVFIIDFEYRLILFGFSITGLCLGAVLGWWMHGWVITLAGGAAGFGIMWLLYQAGVWFIKILSKHHKMPIEEVALGYGDVYLSGIVGLLLGWPGITAGLLLAILLGGAASLLIIVWNLIQKKYQPLQAIPYAPFIIIGAAFLLYR
ncbi:MAG TPA: A24 family peptidase [Anaerolineaceae bacterium]